MRSSFKVEPALELDSAVSYSAFSELSPNTVIGKA